MDVYDLVMLLVLVGATVFGAWKGLAWQVASIAAIVVSYLVAFRFHQPLAGVIDVERPWDTFLAMLILYLGTSLCIWLLFRMISNTIDRLKLKDFDRQVGALFGAAKGVLLCVLITLFAVTLSDESVKKRIVDSMSGYYIAVLLDKSDAVMPDEVHDVLHPYIHKLDSTLDRAGSENEQAPEPAPKPRRRLFQFTASNPD